MNSTSINLYSLTPNFSSSSSSSSCKFANFFNKSLKKLTTTVNFSSIAVSTAKSTANIRFFPVLAIKPHKFFTKFTRTVDSSSVPISSRAKHRFCPKSFNKFTTTIDFNSIAISSTAKNRISPIIATLAANPTFVSGLLAWFLAQSVKVILNFFVERKWEIRVFCRSGGMPSSHSALCTALTTSVAICKGIGDALFAVCLGFSLIVMYDAIGVRRHAGMQAEVLNKIVEDLFQGHPISERKLKELLGHTPSQVLAGAVLGIAVACFCCQSCLVAA